MRTAKYLIVIVGLILSCLAPDSSFAQSAPRTGQLPMPQSPAAPATASGAQAPATQSATAADLGYILGAEDVVQVDVLGRSDFSAKSKVGTDGKIQLPLIGSFPAANRSVLQLREDVREALQNGGFFNKPIVDVVVVSYASRYVTVLGAVGSPGLIPVDRPYRLSEILARVGGVKDNGSDHIVLRTKDDVARNYAIKDLATGDVNLDPYVQPGDKIFAPAADMFYIKGQVKGPGGYGLIPHMTLLMAIARAGGITDLGSDSHIKIMRKNTTLSPKDLNIEVLPDDVIDVGEGWF